MKTILLIVERGILNLVGKTNRLFKSSMPSWIIFYFDIFICFIALLLAFELRFNFAIPATFFHHLVFIFPGFLAVRGLFFYINKSYAAIIRHTGIRDLRILITAIFLGTCVIAGFALGYHFIFQKVLIPFSVIIIDFFISVCLITASRLLIKYIFLEFRNTTLLRYNVIIYGSDGLAIATKRALELDTDVRYQILAFVDDKKQNQSKNIEGVSILPLYKLDYLFENESIHSFIIAKDCVSLSKRKQIIEKCLNYKVKVLSAPKIRSWINADFSVRQLKQINIEDLLERDPIILDTRNIKKEIFHKTILVTGAAGSIGSEIVRQISNYSPQKLILLDQAETPLYQLELEIATDLKLKDCEIIIGDIRDAARMNMIFEKFDIDLIFHAAAYKHVPMMENNPAEAVKNNVLGTKILADLAVKFKVQKFVMISTDKAVNPTNIMGTTKRIAEMYIQSLNGISATRFVTTRFGNVLGSNGSAIPLFKKQIEQGGPVTITHPDITRYFMTIPEACQLVLEASAMGQGGEIFIFDMGKSIKIADLAKNMIRLSGLEVGKDIQIKYIGLRPGEKLYEELLCTKENNLPTYHPKIMIAKVMNLNFELVLNYTNEFEKLIKLQNNVELVKLLKRIVPEFKSKNSIFEILDLHKPGTHISEVLVVN